MSVSSSSSSLCRRGPKAKMGTCNFLKGVVKDGAIAIENSTIRAGVGPAACEAEFAGQPGNPCVFLRVSVVCAANKFVAIRS